MASLLNVAMVTVVAVLSLPSVYPFPSGAPNRACKSMTPGHRNQSPQRGPPPYAIKLSRNSYRLNEQITVTMHSACNNEVFQGFMIQARRVNSSDETPVGYFDFADGVGHVSGCGSFTQAMTHTDDTNKREITLTWTANQVEGDLVMAVTFLKSYSTFWVKVLSEVITDSSTSNRASTAGGIYPTRTVCDTAIPPIVQPSRVPVTTTTSTTTTITTTTTTTPALTTTTPYMRTPQRIFTSTPFRTPTTERTPVPTSQPGEFPIITRGPVEYPKDNLTWPIGSSSTTSAPRPPMINSDCEEKKMCYFWCSSATRCFNVTVEYQSDYIDIDMSMGQIGPDDQWIAIGFSKDAAMGEESVVECVVIGSSVEVFTSYNDGYKNIRIGKEGISDASGSVNDGIIRCSARRQFETTVQKFNYLRSNTEFYLLLASGPLNGNVKLQHSVTPHISPEKISLMVAGAIHVCQEGSQSGRRISVLKAHGSLMLIAWIFTTSLGIIVARYYKLLGGNATCNNDRYSFHIHRACMTITLICVTISIILIFVEVGGLSKVASKKNLILQAHPILGIIVAALVWINFSMGMLRPAPSRSVRPLYNWGHWTTGTAAWISAVVTIFLGLAMPQLDVHPAAKYLVVTFVAVHLLVQLFLEWLSCHVEKSPLDKPPEKMQSVAHEMTTMDGQNGRTKGGFEVREQPQSVSSVGRLKAFVLFTYGFILLCIVFALLLLVNKSS